jgi:hypothetical protein
MTLNKYLFKTTGIALFLVFAFACDDILDTDPFINTVTREEILSNPNLVRLAVNGLYTENLLQNGSYNGDFILYILPAADDVYNTSINYDELKNNSYTPVNPYIGYTWEDFYKSVFYSNDILELVKDAVAAGTISAKEAAVYNAEAKYFRAYSYFELTTLWGDVPLVLSTDILSTSLQPRESKDKVIQLVIDDLKETAATLADATDNTKVTGWAAKALLARQYLFIRNWADAEKLSDDVIKNSGAVLEPELEKVFVRSSRETLFKISTNGTWTQSYWDRTYLGNYSLNASYLRFTDDLAGSFEPGDLRREKWVKEQTTSGVTYFQSYKYRRNLATSTGEAEDHVLFRLAEQYLIRAEARAQQDKLTGADGAIADLNAIRERAGLPDLPQTLNKEQVLLAVENERRHELFVEDVHRWWDLVRTGRADAILGDKTKFPDKQWAPHKALLPIPDAEIENNPNLTPNPGYGK